MSSPSSTFDAVVIGGGPAGTATAMRLAGFGARVALVDRPTARSRRQHVGESLPSSARVVLETLGLDLPADVVERRPREHLVYWGAMQGAPSRPPSSKASAESSLLVWRGRLDRFLREEAARRGVRVLDDVAARSAREREDGWELLLDGRVGFVQGRFLVDASGRSGVVARAHRERERAFRTLALTAHFETSEREPPTLVESFPSGWVWSAPLSNRLRDVTLMVDGSGGAASGDTRARFERGLESVVHVRELVTDAPFEGEVRGIDATPYGARRYAFERALLVGDAASFLDPISAHGVHKAMDGALVAAAVARTILERPSRAADARRFYDDREASLVRLTRERVSRLYRRETRFASEPFWAARSGGALPGEETAPPPALPPLRMDMTLRTAEGIELLEAPVLENDFIERRKVLVGGRVDRPARFHGQISLPDLFARVAATETVEDAVRSSPHGVDRAFAAVEWLYHHGFLTSEPQS